MAFSHGSESAVIYCFYPFLFVIWAEFIIRLFALGIAVEKWYQMCLWNLKVLSLLKRLELILCSFLSDDFRNLAYGKKVNFWIKTDRFFFSTAVDSSWWVDQSICHAFFDRKIPSWDISVRKFKGVDNFSSKVHAETKNRPIQKWYQMCLLNFKISLIAMEIRVYLVLLSKSWR